MKRTTSLSYLLVAIFSVLLLFVGCNDAPNNAGDKSENQYGKEAPTYAKLIS